MEYRVSQRFLEDLRTRAAQPMQRHILDTVRDLSERPDLPGLQVRRTAQGLGGVWYCRINQDWRLLFDWGEQREPVLLRAVPHKVFDHLTRGDLGNHELLDWQTEPPTTEGEAREFEVPADWSRKPANADYPLRSFTVHQLRLLGVPAELARVLRDAPTIDDALALSGLAEQQRDWLMALHTDPNQPLSDPFRVFKRATLEQLEAFARGTIQDLLLQLADDQMTYVERDYPGPLLLKGCAGSGKSTVGVHRAIRLARQGRQVLLITHNPILQQVTRSLVEAVTGELPPGLHVEHFRAWVLRMLHSAGFAPDLIGEEDAHALVAAAVKQVRASGVTSAVLRRDPSFFHEEIERVIKGFGLSTLDDYRNAPRYGRKTALSPLGRSVVWQVYEAYQRLLAQHARHDWGDAVAALYDLTLQRPELVGVDDVIVDEAQDLTPLELRVLQRTVRGGEGERPKTILVLGDAAQSLYSRGFTWKQVGLDVRGRSHALKVNYRNTREVVRSAADLAARNRHLRDHGELIPMESVARSGPRPVVVMLDGEHRVRDFVIERVTAYREQNLLRLRDVAVIAADEEAARQYAFAIGQRGIPADHWGGGDAEADILGESVKVMSIRTAKGLEFPVVFMVGLTAHALGQGARDVEKEEREIAVERERMRLYVGMTRSAELLYLVVDRTQASPFIGELSHVELQETT